MNEMTDIERLIALEDLKRLKSRRDRAVDMKDWATFEALHAPEHRSHNDGYPPWNSAAELVTNVKKGLEELPPSIIRIPRTSRSNLLSRPAGYGRWRTIYIGCKVIKSTGCMATASTMRLMKAERSMGVHHPTAEANLCEDVTGRHLWAKASLRRRAPA